MAPTASKATPADQSRPSVPPHARPAEIVGPDHVSRPASRASVLPTRHASTLRIDAVMIALMVSMPARDGASFLKPLAGLSRLKSGVSGEVETLNPLCNTELS